MPVYLRKDQSWAPASLLNESFALDDADFIQDPDQQRDQLPQPYRMINKVLGRIIDSVWDHISDRESDRIADAARFRPPQYECAVHIEDDSKVLTKTECMSQTPDGHYIILGLENGLAAINANNQQIVDVHPEESLHVASMKICTLGEDRYLMVLVDDMGSAKVFALAGEKIYNVTALSDSDANNKVIVSKVEVATSGDFVAIFLEKPSIQEGWVEIHKVPKDAWLKDLDRLVNKATQKDISSSSQAAPPKSPVPHDESVGVEVAPSSDGVEPAGESVTGGAEETTREQRTQSPTNQRSSHSFANTTTVIKVLPPAGLTASSTSSVSAACKLLDNHGDVLGTGAHHLLSHAHLELRKDVFTQYHRDEIKYLAQETDKASVPTMHFLCSGRILSHGNDAAKTDQPSSVAIWWSNETQVMMYSLHKTSKDLEHKPDLVLPMSAAVVASSVSPDGSQMALVMDNNNLVIWDMYLGLSKGTIHLCDEGHVTQLTFLDPSVSPQTVTDYPPYPTATSYYLLVAMDDGQVGLVNCGHLGEPPIRLDLNIVKPDEIPTFCEPVDGIPDLLLTCRMNGCVYLHDVHRGNQICEVILPPEYSLTSPWQPLIAVGAKGGMMYLKGSPVKPPSPLTVTDDDDATASDTDHQEEPPDNKLFVFTLRSFPTLDKYRARERPQLPYTVHSQLHNRVDALLANRLKGQSSRVSHLQMRWDNLRDEVELLQKLRADRRQTEQRNTYSVTSIAKSPFLQVFA